MKAWEYLSGWTNFGLPSNIQKRLYQFLLRKSIGQFIQSDLDNFDVDLKNGYIELRKLELNLEKLNDILNGVPLLLERGQVESIQVSLPWSNLSSGDVYLKIQGVNVDLIPTNKKKPDLNMEDQSILSTSLHFADDFFKTQIEDDEELKQSVDDLQSEPIEGLEIITRMIDKILSRFKIDIFDTNIRIIDDKSPVSLSSCEYEQSNIRYALELCIPQVSYFDETPGFDTAPDSQTDDNKRHIEDSTMTLPPVARETVKIITIKSPSVWLISLKNDITNDNDDDSLSDQSRAFLYMNYSIENTQFYEAEQGNSMILDSSSVGGTNTPKANDHHQPYRSLLLTTLDKDNWIRIKQLNNSSPIKQLDFLVTHARVTITPKQLTFLVDLLGRMTTTQQNPVSPSPQLFQSVDMRASSLSSTKSIHLDSSQPRTTTKIQFSLAELYLLSHEVSIDRDDYQSFDKINHIRLSVNNAITRLENVLESDMATLYSVISLSISTMALDEWIIKPPEASDFTCYGTSNQKLFQTNYNTYTSIIIFNDSISNAYNKDEMFPVYSDEHYTFGEEKRAIRVRIENHPLNLRDQYTNGSSYNQDITTDIQPFKITIDPQIINRLENYVFEFKNSNKSQEQEQRVEQLSELAVYEDLDRQARKLEEKKRVKIKLAFIRIVLFVPDMSQVCLRNEFNDRFHSDQLSLDIAALEGTWNSQLSTDTSLASEIYTTVSKSKPKKLSITLDYINVFLKQHDENMTKCWFTAKSTPISSNDIQPPTIDIIVRNSLNNTNTNTGSNFIKFLFDHINNKEQSKQNNNPCIPIDFQTESILNFKKYALRNSIFQINCHFPTSQVKLSKKQWDKIQVLQNDVILWQPHFLQSPSFDQSYDSTSGSSNQYSSSESTSYSNEKASYSKNLFSLSAILSQSIWKLQCTDELCYRIDFTEFQFFSVIKHLGQNENITILDIDDLRLDDISSDGNEKRIILKAIPDKINDKRNIPMVSLVSRLSLLLESNFQHKDSSITLNQLRWKATNNLETDFVDHIIAFQKEPKEIVFINPVIQRAKIYVRLLDSYIDYIPDQSPSRGALFLDEFEVFTSTMPSQSSIDITLSIKSADILLVDDKVELKKALTNQKFKSNIGSKEYLKAVGFLSVLKLQKIKTQIKIKLDDHLLGPKLDLVLSNMDIRLSTCTDSFQTLINLVTYVTSQKTDNTTENQSQEKTPAYVVEYNLDIFASMDESSFNRSKFHILPRTNNEFQLGYVEEYFIKDKHTSKIVNIPPEKPFRKHRVQKNDNIIRVLSDDLDQFQIVDDFYQADANKNSSNSETSNYKPVYRIQVKNVNFKWKLYDGYDWDYLRADMASINHTKKRQQRTKEHVQSGFGDEIEDYVGTQPDPHLSPSISRRISRDPSMEIVLSSLSTDIILMSENDPTSMHLDFRIKDIDIFDNIKTSKWNKFLGYMRSNNLKEPRETNSCMLNVELIGLRPVPEHPKDQEHRLKVKILPTRLFIDQDALYFLVKYFTFDPSYLRSTVAIVQTLSNLEKPQNKKKETPIFFQFVYIYPLVLKIDYKAKHIDYGKIKNGRFAELVNLINLDGAQVKLNRIKMTGIKGWDGLLGKLSDEWIDHVKNTQLGSMVSGITPIRPMVNLSKGVSDMVRLPIKQYKKDGRVIGGIAKGTQSLARATTIELIKLSSKVASGTQVALEHADGFFSSNNNTGDSSSSSSFNNQDELHFVYTDINGVEISNDDEDIFKGPISLKGKSREYASFDYFSLSKDHGSNSEPMYTLPNDQMESGEYYNDTESSTSSIKTTRSTSSGVIKPLINLTSAFQTILAGLRNSIDPVTRIQNEDKYKRFK